MEKGDQMSVKVRWMAQGPFARVKKYKRCIINDFLFVLRKFRGRK